MGRGNTCARIDWNWNLIFSENEIFARGTYLKYILKQWDRATFPTAYLIICNPSVTGMEWKILVSQ